MSKFAIQLKKINKSYQLKEQSERFFALKNVNLKIKKGEKVGIVGKNGAGKTTLLKILSEVNKADSGMMKIEGKLVSLISLTSGFHPEFTGRENLYLNASILGLNNEEIKKIESGIIKFANIDQFIDEPLYTYSSGMILRLGFSVAIHVNPDILILDEEIIVGDQDFQEQAFRKIEEIFSQGKTVIVSSHWLTFLKKLCDRFIWLDKGKIKMDGGKEVLIEYQKTREKWWESKLQLFGQPSYEIFQLLHSLPMGEKFTMTAASSSMEPDILMGDIVEAERVKFKDIEIGDIVVFWSEEVGQIIMHRVAKIDLKTKTFSSKGDSNLLREYKIKEEHFIGKFKKIKKK